MTVAFVQLPADGTGKKLATESWTQGADTVHGEKFLICDASGNVVAVKNVAPAAGDYALVTRNIPSGTQAVDGSAVTQPVSGTFWQATQPVSAASLPLPAGAAQEHATAASPHSVRLSDGTTFIIAASQADVQAVRDRLPAALDADGGLKAHIQNFPATQPVSGTVDVSDRDARLAGRVKNLDSAGTVIDPALKGQLPAALVGGRLDVNIGAPATLPVSMATNTPDVTDRAAREVGRVRVWDGTRELTLLAGRTAPAATNNAAAVTVQPAREPVYEGIYTSFAPAITAGVKPGFTLWHPNTDAKDYYIVSIAATILVTTAGTAGRTALQLQMISADGATGTTGTQALDSGGAASTSTFRVNPGTDGTGSGNAFAGILAMYAAQPVGRIDVPVWQATSMQEAIVLRGGTNAGLKGVENQEVAGTALVYQIGWRVRWLEL